MQFIGASDSAAACAIMIQLARCLNDSLHNALNYTARGQVGSFASIVHYSYVAVTDIKSVTRNNFYEQLVCVGDSFWVSISCTAACPQLPTMHTEYSLPGP